MVLFDEKRQKTDRRCSNDGPPLGARERRKARNRRQTVIAEITLNEWVKSYLKFQKHMAAKARREEAAENADKPMDSIADAPSVSDWPKTREKRSLGDIYSQPPGNSRFSQDSQSPISGF